MKILLSSNGPHTPTGYGGQSKLMASAFMAHGHELDFFAWYGLQGAAVEAGPYKMWPQLGDDQWGNNAVIIAKREESDVVVTLCDIWVLDEDYAEKLDGIPWVAYFPVDAAPLSPAIEKRAATATYPVVFSLFASRLLSESQINHTYIPHAIHPAYHMVDEEIRHDIRDHLEIEEDQFVIGMVAANKGYPSRKGFDAALIAFQNFLEHVDDRAVMYIHCDPVGNGAINLHYMVDDFGLTGKVIFPDRAKYLLAQYTEEELNNLYNAMDVLLMPSMGEGFGLPSIEAQAAGTPVVVQDCSSMPELVTIGRVFQKGLPHYVPLRSIQWMPNFADILDALHAEYEEWQAAGGSKERHRELAEQVRTQYSIKRIGDEFWAPFLARVESELEDSS